MTCASKSRLVAAALPLLLALSACSGDGGKGDGDPGDVMGTAKAILDDTSGVHLVLETPKLPDEVSGVTKAEGIATHQPGFEGAIDLVYSGINANVKVIAVGGSVGAVLPFTRDYVDVDPADYNAPDPAGLMDPDAGISAWLTKAKGVEKDRSVRDGDEVLTSYQGTLDGTVVVSAIPSADSNATFPATFTIDEDGRLRTASVTGPFYQGKPELTYEVTFTEYDTKKEIAAPPSCGQ